MSENTSKFVRHTWPCDEGHAYHVTHLGACTAECISPPDRCAQHVPHDDRLDRWELGPLFAQRYRGKHARSWVVGAWRWSLGIVRVKGAGSVELSWKYQ